MVCLVTANGRATTWRVHVLQTSVQYSSDAGAARATPQPDELTMQLLEALSLSAGDGDGDGATEAPWKGLLALSTSQKAPLNELHTPWPEEVDDAEALRRSPAAQPSAVFAPNSTTLICSVPNAGVRSAKGGDSATTHAVVLYCLRSARVLRTLSFTEGVQCMTATSMLQPHAEAASAAAPGDGNDALEARLVIALGTSLNRVLVVSGDTGGLLRATLPQCDPLRGLVFVDQAAGGASSDGAPEAMTLGIAAASGSAVHVWEDVLGSS